MALSKTINVTNTCEKIVRGKSNAVFCLGHETLQRPSEFNSKLVEHRARSSVLEFNMLAVSIAEEFPTARSRVHLYNNCDK